MQLCKINTILRLYCVVSGTYHAWFNDVVLKFISQWFEPTIPWQHFLLQFILAELTIVWHFDSWNLRNSRALKISFLLILLFHILIDHHTSFVLIDFRWSGRVKFVISGIQKKRSQFGRAYRLQISLRSRKWAASKSCDRTERNDCSKDVFSGIFTGVGFEDQLSRYVKLPHNLTFTARSRTQTVMRCVIKSDGNESSIVRLPISLKVYTKASACNTLSCHPKCCTSVGLKSSRIWKFNVGCT